MPTTITNIPAAEYLAPHRAILDDLIKLGHELARMVVEDAKAEVLSAVEAGVAFERIFRGVRRGIALARKLDEPVPTTDRVAARKQIIRAVEDQIERHADPAEADTLHLDLQDRLDSPDLEDEIVVLCSTRHHALAISIIPTA